MDKEILDGFKEESNQILKELENILEVLETPSKDFPTQSLNDFAQKIDRVMGTAATLSMDAPNHVGLKRIDQLARLCKGLGYKAGELKIHPLIPIFAAFWADVVEVLTELVDSVEDEVASKKIAEDFSAVLQKRLEWLSGRIGQAAPPSSAQSTQQEINDLLKSFGM